MMSDAAVFVPKCECGCKCYKPLTQIEIDYYDTHPEEHRKLCGDCYWEMGR